MKSPKSTAYNVRRTWFVNKSTCSYYFFSSWVIYYSKCASTSRGAQFILTTFQCFFYIACQFFGNEVIKSTFNFFQMCNCNWCQIASIYLLYFYLMRHGQSLPPACHTYRIKVFRRRPPFTERQLMKDEYHTIPAKKPYFLDKYSSYVDISHFTGIVWHLFFMNCRSVGVPSPHIIFKTSLPKSCSEKKKTCEECVHNLYREMHNRLQLFEFGKWITE